MSSSISVVVVDLVPNAVAVCLNVVVVVVVCFICCCCLVVIVVLVVFVAVVAVVVGVVLKTPALKSNSNFQFSFKKQTLIQIPALISHLIKKQL